MKTLRLLLLALFALLVPATAENAPLKVISWNMEWFPGKRPTASAAEAAQHMKAGQEALKAMAPDIFIGVEMTDWDAFHQLCSVVPGLTVHVVSTFVDPLTGEIRPQQIGIASKLKCHGAWWSAWKANVPNISRGFSFAALEAPAPTAGGTGGLLMVYGNHLKSNSGSNDAAGAKNIGAMRDEQAKQLLSHMTEVTTAYSKYTIQGWVIGGDFNTNHDGQFPDCHVVDILTKGGLHNTWLGVPKEQRLTWRSEPGGRYQPTTFDYIFTKGLGELTVSTIEQSLAVSDHLPVQLLVPAAK